MAFRCSKHAQIGLAKLSQNHGCMGSFSLGHRAFPRLQRSTAQIRWKASTRPSIAHEYDHLFINGGLDVRVGANQRFRPTMSAKQKPIRSMPPSSEPTELQGPLSLSETSPATVAYTGNTILPLTSELQIVEPGAITPHPKWPVFRIMVSPIV